MERELSYLQSATYSEAQYRSLLVELFRGESWQINPEALIGDSAADLVISRGDLRYCVALKVSSEGRRDRLVALISQAILEAKAAAASSSDKSAPLAVVMAPSIPRGTADELVAFRSKVASDVSVGILDREGLRRFVGPGLESLTTEPRRSARKQKLRVPDSANLFSDLNQWLLKVLLAPLISEDLLTAPRAEYRNATDLAKAAKVSVMSAFRFIRQLEQDRFLDDESEILSLVNREELMRRWQANYLRQMPEMPLRWIEQAKNEHQVSALLRAFDGEFSSESVAPACLGLSAAAKCLGFESAQRVPPRFYYLGNLDRAVLKRMGFSPDDAEFMPDLFIRQLVFRKSVFKAAVIRDGILVSDIIQIWLDITSPLGRDQELADQIRKYALAKIFGKHQ